MSTDLSDDPVRTAPSGNGWRARLSSNPISDLVRLALIPGTLSPHSKTADWIRRRPVPALITLAYGLTWIGLIPLVHDPGLAAQANLSHARNPAVLVYAFLGVLGCLWAALIVAGAVGGRAGRYALLRRYLQWQAGILWYLVVLFLPAILFGLAVGLNLMLTGSPPAVPAFDLAPAILLPTFGFFLVRFMLGNFEEICWRASLLPRLQARKSALIASLLVGLVQGFWHLPFLFVKGHYVQVIGLPAILIQSAAMSVVFAWVYNNTRGSLLLVALFHASYDALSQFAGVDHEVLLLTIGMWCMAALLIVIVYGARHLSRKPPSELAYTVIAAETPS
jgi:uncharacterized protein